jgi:hypothetical protein
MAVEGIDQGEFERRYSASQSALTSAVPLLPMPPVVTIGLRFVEQDQPRRNNREN